MDERNSHLTKSSRSSDFTDSSQTRAEDLSYFISCLDSEEVNLIIFKDGERLYSSRKGGIAPLLGVIDSLGLKNLADSIVVDKIVGKAAALLILYFKAKEVYSKLMSNQAAEFLERHGTKFLSGNMVDKIKSKDGTDVCPFEKAVLEVEDPTEGHRKLRAVYSLMR